MDVFIPEEVFYSPKNRTDFIYQVFSSSTKAKKVASNIIRQNGGFSKFKKEPNSFSDYERIGEYKYSSIQIFSHYIGKSMVVVALRYVPVRMHRYSSYVVGILEINNSLSENNKTIKFNNITLRKAVKEWLEDDKKAEATYGHISNWDTSEVTDMNELFLDAHTFNEPIGNWDVSNVTIMRSLFAYASAFNQDISSWDVGSVTDMSYMFTGTPFNQHIGNWDVSNVTDMQEMFWGDTKFNQPIGNWDVSNVTNMESMFRDALSFNQDLSNWDVNIYSGKINGESAYIDFSNETPQWTLQKPNFTKTALEDEGGVIHLQKEGNYFYYTNENGEKDQFIADKLLVESPEDNKLEFIVRDEIEEALDSKYIIFVTKGDEVFRIIDLPEIEDSEFENSVGVLTDSDKPLKSSEEAVQFVKNIKTISFNDIGVIADYNKAIADYTKAIELEPNKSRAYYNRGFLKHEFNDDTGAIADYNIAIRLDPNYADAYYNRGLSRYLLGDKNGRDRDFLKAQQLGGDGFYVHE